MPYKHGHRKKKRTQKAAPITPFGEKVPKSFVLRRGKVDKTVKQLVTDVRQMMLPHTADHLKERNTNTLKDFISVAGPMGVSHMLLFSQTDTGNVNMRVGVFAHGPSLTFRLHTYSLARQVKAAQKRPVDIAGAYLTPPLVMLHNFNNLPPEASTKAAGTAGVSLADALKLTRITFQNMFPSFNPATVKLSECRRVLLLHYDKKAGHIELRHYIIRAVPVGVSRGVKKVLAARVPDLSRLDDVAEFVLNGGRSGGGGGGGGNVTSDSEFEDETSRVVLPQDYHGSGNVRAQQSAIKLSEIGPRMTFTLIKAEDGLFEGEVLYHAFESRNAEEAANLRARAAEKESLRASRRAEQEANVSRKAAEKASKKAAKEDKRKERQLAAEKAAAEGRLGEEEEEEEKQTKTSKKSTKQQQKAEDLDDDEDDDSESDDNEEEYSDAEDDADNEDADSDEVTDDDDDDDDNEARRRTVNSNNAVGAGSGGTVAAKGKNNASSSTTTTTTTNTSASASASAAAKSRVRFSNPIEEKGRVVVGDAVNVEDTLESSSDDEDDDEEEEEEVGGAGKRIGSSTRAVAVRDTGSSSEDEDDDDQSSSEEEEEEQQNVGSKRGRNQKQQQQKSNNTTSNTKPSQRNNNSRNNNSKAKALGITGKETSPKSILKKPAAAAAGGSLKSVVTIS